MIDVGCAYFIPSANIYIFVSTLIYIYYEVPWTQNYEACEFQTCRQGLARCLRGCEELPTESLAETPKKTKKIKKTVTKKGRGQANGGGGEDEERVPQQEHAERGGNMGDDNRQFFKDMPES